MILYGTKEYFTQLIQIWQEAFGDRESLIAFFLQKTVHRDEIYIWVEDGLVKGMLYALPCTIKGKSGFYWYALATRKKYRGQGIMTRLMEKAASDAKEKEAAFIWLQPADQDLFRYYAKNGFTDRIPRREGVEKNVGFPQRVLDYIRLENEEDLQTSESAQEADRLPSECFFRWFGEKLISELVGPFPE